MQLKLGKQNVGFLGLGPLSIPVCWTGLSNTWSDSLGGSVVASNWSGGSMILASVPGLGGVVDVPGAFQMFHEHTLNRN